ADADRQASALAEAGILDEGADFLGDRERVSEPRAGQEQHEFLAACTEERVEPAQPLPDQRHELLQDAVTLRMTESVVDVLETVDVEQQERRSLAGSTPPLDRRRQGEMHLPPVERAGQRISDHVGLEYTQA